MEASSPHFKSERLGLILQHGLVERVSLVGVVCEAAVPEDDGVLKPAAHWEGVSHHCPLRTRTRTRKTQHVRIRSSTSMETA